MSKNGRFGTNGLTFAKFLFTRYIRKSAIIDGLLKPN